MGDAETQASGERRTWSVWRLLLLGQLMLSLFLWFGMCLWSDLPNPTSGADILFFSLLVWLCESLGFWAGLGSRLWRFVVIAFAAPCLGAMGSVAANGEFLEFQVFSLGVFSVVGLTTGLLRWFAGSLRRAHGLDNERDGLQFGIQQVMVFTGVLAVLFGVWRFLMGLGIGLGGRISTPVEIAALAASMSVATVAAVWAILGARMLILRMIGMILATVGTVALTHVLSQEFLFTASTLGSQVLFWLTLLLLRLDGYRFLKRPSV